MIGGENAVGQNTSLDQILLPPQSETDDECGDVGNHDEEDTGKEMLPLISSTRSENPLIRSRKKILFDFQSHFDMEFHTNIAKRERLKLLCNKMSKMKGNILRNTVTAMSFLARVLFWISLLAMVGGVFWYSRELALHGTETEHIAWFSAGAFVILGFPISIYGIIMHLSNYYQPNIQCYVVRILWMVPLYSIESWLCLRFHTWAIYIETLRDCYESFVLYCFLQYLIEVLGGEEALIILLKDKSPTRGVHYMPLHWCMKPWIMGQPISKMVLAKHNKNIPVYKTEVQWTSPFFVKCKFGVLQYVLLKCVSSIFVMVFEVYGLYKEGDFTPKGGYLYICILTNTSQCWALYCMIFFYYATKTELEPIRPVGKFLSVKALVFFTWWQSVGISILYQLDLITEIESWSAEDVAKALQDYLICIEMFVGAIVHTYVFPHTDYMKPLVMKARTNETHGKRLIGRRFKDKRKGHRKNKFDQDMVSKASDGVANDRNLEKGQTAILHEKDDENNLTEHTSNLSHCQSPHGRTKQLESYRSGNEDNKFNLDTVYTSRNIMEDNSEVDHEQHPTPKGKKQIRTGFVRAFIDSTVPRDVMDSTVGIARGDFTVEKRTLLYHAATSDEYELFSKKRRMPPKLIEETSRID